MTSLWCEISANYLNKMPLFDGESMSDLHLKKGFGFVLAFLNEIQVHDSIKFGSSLKKSVTMKLDRYSNCEINGKSAC